MLAARKVPTTFDVILTFLTIITVMEINKAGSVFIPEPALFPS